MTNYTATNVRLIARTLIAEQDHTEIIASARNVDECMTRLLRAEPVIGSPWPQDADMDAMAVRTGIDRLIRALNSLPGSALSTYANELSYQLGGAL